MIRIQARVVDYTIICIALHCITAKTASLVSEYIADRTRGSSGMDRVALPSRGTCGVVLGFFASSRIKLYVYVVQKRSVKHYSFSLS